MYPEVLDMRRALFAAVSFLFFCAPLRSQVAKSSVKVRVILVDKDLNQKPVPHLTIVLAADPDQPDPRLELKTDFGGIAEFQASPGKYRLTTPQGVDFQGRHFSWEMDLQVSGESVSVDLSNDNARAADPPAVEPAHKVDDLTLMFQKYQKSVVTVWSEIGSGTGFIVDSAGLVMTNQHVIGPSDLISIQFDPKRKVAAKVLAYDAERDVAILYADLSAFPGAAPAPIATSQPGRELAVEGERVFTIGSPLGLKKIITSGIVSKVEARAIISDVNVNHGNSGGPLFNSEGEVIGMTTFLEPTPNGPGLSGIVRIDQTTDILGRARRKVSDVPRPSARLLPVEPTDPYPLSSLKDTIKSSKVDLAAYIFKLGNFDVMLETPVLKYKLQAEGAVEAVKGRGKRTRKWSGSKEKTFDPLEDMRGWEEYTGEYKPILTIVARPQFQETFMSEWLRGIPSSGNILGGGPARFKFRTDFHSMKLLCGADAIEPIQSVRILDLVSDDDSSVKFKDATYQGAYFYPPDAISPSCGKVTLQIFSEKDPNRAESKELDSKSVDRVWNDFRPYLAAHGNAGN